MDERDVDIEQFERGAESETGCSIDMSTVQEQATWYSILNTTSLVLGSGMGIALDDQESSDILRHLDESPERSSTKGAQLLKAVFRSGDPALCGQFSTRDFSAWRWDQDTFDRTLVPQAQGWAILQETECAKWFSIPVGAEGVDADLQKEWKSNALLLCALARKQCEFAFSELRDGQGLFVGAAEPGSIRFTDTSTNLEDQMCMLWACTNLADVLDNRDSYPFLADIRRAQRFADLADGLFLSIADNQRDLLSASRSSVLAQALAVRALVWYAACTRAQDLQARALWMLRDYADSLVRAEDESETVGDTLVDAAAALTALVDAFRVTRLRTYAEAATRIFDFVESQWWELSGTYSPTPLANEYTYNAADIGIILGALNTSRLFLGERIDRDLAELRLRVFFCEAVDLSGLQMSMPGMDFLPNWLQQREPSVHFRHGSIPLPSEAGIAPVFAAEVSYDPLSDTWARQRIFDTAAAMRACCEFLWIDHDAVDGFPEIQLDHAPIAVRRAAGAEV